MGNIIINTKLKRLLAFLFDIAFIALLAFTIYMLCGMIFKIDSDGFLDLIFIPLLILITGYMFFGELIFKNTLGKYLTGIEVSGKGVSVRPSIKSFLKRGVLKILFPVEALVLLFSGNNSRLGDIWAKTVVVDKESGRLNAASGFVIGIAVLIALVLTFRISMGFAVRKADFYNTGIDYLYSSGNVKITGMVKVVNQTRKTVNFIVPVSNETTDTYAVIFLRKSGNVWSVDSTAFIKEHIAGFSYGYDFSSSDK
jgi:uncharacterized RDD family membrane protein YckC